MNIVILCANREDGQIEINRLIHGTGLNIVNQHNFVLIYESEQLNDIEVNAISTTMKFWNKNRHAHEIFSKAESQLKDVI